MGVSQRYWSSLGFCPIRIPEHGPGGNDHTRDPQKLEGSGFRVWGFT